MLLTEASTGPLDTVALVDEFLADCAGLSASTRSNYRWALDRLISHCPTLPQTRRELALVFDAPKRDGDPLQPESKRQLRKVLRIFYAWCVEEYGATNAAAGVRAIPPDAPPIRWLRGHEIDQLLREAGGFGDFTRGKVTRDSAILATFLNTGIRLGELADLKPADIQPGRLSVYGKTGHREVPISTNVEDLIRLQVQEDVVWPSMRGGGLSRRGIQGIVSRLIRSAGIHGHRLGPHTLRHSYATNFVINSLAEGRDGEIDLLQYLMGHQRREQTERYVHLAKAERASQAHARNAPLADRFPWDNPPAPFTGETAENR